MSVGETSENCLGRISGPERSSSPPHHRVQYAGNISSEADMLVAFITFVCTFSCALAATLIRSRLPPTHLSKESQDVVRLGIGLVATMTALLLGLVTAAARSTFDSQDVAIRNSGAAILTLDRHLARYGPETQPIRDLIRRAIGARIREIWHNDS